VFDQEHASDMRSALNNLNSDLVRQYPDYVCRMTADEADIGRGYLSRFQDVESRSPVILTTSQLLRPVLMLLHDNRIPFFALPSVNSLPAFKNSPSLPNRRMYEFGRIDAASPPIITVPMSFRSSWSLSIVATGELC
jgi:hypothetical protein